MNKDKILVAVGSTRKPKLSAVSAALKELGPLLHPHEEFGVVGVAVASGVGHTPLGRAELMAGARRRGEELRRLAGERSEPWRYFVGLEGGLEVVQEGGLRRVFLENWAFVTDVTGREGYGQAGGTLLPAALAAEVLDRGAELSAAIDRFAEAQGIRDAQGAVGVLTRNLITREEALRLAVIQAFAPFFNAQLYDRALL